MILVLDGHAAAYEEEVPESNATPVARSNALEDSWTKVVADRVRQTNSDVDAHKVPGKSLDKRHSHRCSRSWVRHLNIHSTALRGSYSPKG